MTMYPGAGAQRQERSSRCMFHWRSSDGMLDALTGHKATFEIDGVGREPGTVTDIYGQAMKVGSGQPRWDQAPARGLVSRLTLEANVAGQDQEYLWWTQWRHAVQPISLYWKVFPKYAPGANVTAVPWFGPMAGTNHLASGGFLAIVRLGASWQVHRSRAGTVLTAQFTESAGTVYPIELLATMTSGGAIQLFGRDAALATWQSTVATNIVMANPLELWGDSQVAASGIQQVTDAEGGQCHHETIKIIRGVKTFTEIELLS